MRPPSRRGGVSNQIAPSSLSTRQRGAAAVACSGDPILHTAAAARRAGNGSSPWAAMEFDVETVGPLGELRMWCLRESWPDISKLCPPPSEGIVTST